MRFVFDTTVLVSAVLFREGKPRRAFDTALAEGVVLLSLPALPEISEVLSRKKFDRYLRQRERARFVAGLVRSCEWVEIEERVQVCRDPKDDHILELAVNGSADRIISSDDDLLVPSPFRGIPICPRTHSSAHPEGLPIDTHAARIQRRVEHGWRLRGRFEETHDIVGYLAYFACHDGINVYERPAAVQDEVV